MATKYEYRRCVTHKCGHVVTHNLHAHNRQEADQWAHNLRKTDCNRCREMRQVRDREIMEESRKAGFPELRGSVAQLSWARAIRSRIYGALQRSAIYADEATLCRYEPNASWWIDNRSKRLDQIVAHLRDLVKSADVAA